MKDIEKYFQKLRHSERHHQGLGDVRLTLAQQEELVERFEDLLTWIERTGEQYDICTRDATGRTCSTCRCGWAGESAYD